MDEAHVSIITCNMVQLLKKIDLRDGMLWAKLLQHEVIADEQYSAIKDTSKDNQQEVQALLMHLKKKSEAEWTTFIRCLEETNHSHVAKMLSGERKGWNSEQKEAAGLLPPKLLFVAECEAALDSHSTSVFGYMKQNIKIVDRKISIDCLTEEKLQDKDLLSYTHIIRTIPKAGSPLNVTLPEHKVSHVISCTVDEYCSNNETKNRALDCRENYLAIGRSEQNFFLGMKLFKTWSQVMEHGDPHSEYVPGCILQDDSMYAELHESNTKARVVVDLDTTYEVAEKTMASVDIALDGLNTYMTIEVICIVASPCPFQTNLIQLLEKHTKRKTGTKNCFVVKLESRADVLGFQDNAVWLFLHPAKHNTWLRFFPVSRGIPHIVTSDTELYRLYEGVSPGLIKEHAVTEPAALKTAIHKKLSSMRNAYASAKQLSREFYTNAPVIRSQGALLKACIGSHIATIVISWTDEGNTDVPSNVNPHLAQVLQQVISEKSLVKRTRRGGSDVAGSLPSSLARKVIRFLYGLFGYPLEASSGSIKMRSYMRDQETMSTLTEMITDGRAVLYMRNALVLIYRHVFKKNPPGHTVTLTFHPPSAARLNGDTVTRQSKKFQMEDETLFDVTRAGNVEKLKKLLTEESYRRNINDIGEDGETALTLALDASREHLRNRCKVVEELLLAGADPDQENVDGETPLTLMFKTDKLLVSSVVQVIDLLLENEANVKKANKNEETVLNLLLGHKMVYMPEMKKILQQFLDASVNVNQKDQNGYNSLLAVVRNTSVTPRSVVQIIRILLSDGADVNCLDSEMKSVLHLVMENPVLATDVILKIMDQLDSCSINMNQQDVDGNTAILLAAKSQRTTLKLKVQIIERLMSKHADVNLANKFGETVLTEIVKIHWAEKGIFSFVRTLLTAGVDPNMQDKEGNSAAHVLLNKLVAEVRKEDQGHTMSQQQVQGYVQAPFKQEIQELLEILLPGDPFINMQNKNGLSILMLVCAIGSSLSEASQIVRSLLESGADPNLQDRFGSTALFLAAERAHVEESVNQIQIRSPLVKTEKELVQPPIETQIQDTLSLLIEYGADVDRQDKSGNTAMMYGFSCRLKLSVDQMRMLKAMSFGTDYGLHKKKRWLRILLEGGACVNLQNKSGHTALLLAIENYNGQTAGAQDIIELLLAGASPNTEDKTGQTPVVEFLSSALWKLKNIGLSLKEWDVFLNQIEEVLHQMICAGVDVNKTVKGHSALSYSWLLGDAGITQKVLESGASAECVIPETYEMPPIITQTKHTLLQFVSYKGSPLAVSYVLHYGAKMTVSSQATFDIFLFVKPKTFLLEFIWHGIPFFPGLPDNSLLNISFDCPDPDFSILAKVIALGYDVSYVKIWITEASDALSSGLEEQSAKTPQTPSVENVGKKRPGATEYESSDMDSGMPLVPCATDAVQVSTERLAALAWLNDRLTTPQPLKTICRWTIRESLVTSTGGSSVIANAYSLNIPKKLISYILLEESLSQAGLTTMKKEDLPPLQNSDMGIRSQVYVSSNMMFGPPRMPFSLQY